MGTHPHSSHGEGLEIAGIGPLTLGSLRAGFDLGVAQSEATVRRRHTAPVVPWHLCSARRRSDKLRCTSEEAT